ncbi:outer membrane protein assembly factor BamD [Terracidiphilus sp.]|jgi:outer membrane protein assembly factor BamD|uniref:outer membrane protein assembly factor BamD n=1 Tax=Terracidiphilus sp. TaxID=1964191 RepID=UPI003C212FB8
MNRLSNRIVAAALAALIVPGVLAFASDQKPKKDQDLSANPLADLNSKQPDKELFDKAMAALKKGKFDVARLDLQTMLNTYPDSEYRMRAKLAVGDTWFKEGGTAALTQAEAEYKDFITFFPDAPEAAEAQMKVGDIYYQQMEKPDRDFTNALEAEKAYRQMINLFPDSTLIPRAKQKLRNVQEVLGEREMQIGLYYQSRADYPATIARLQTVVDAYPLYSKSDLAMLTIGDAYAGEAKAYRAATAMPGAMRERLASLYSDKAAAAYDKVITHYPMAPRVEDAKDRLVAMNRPVPEPTKEVVAENEAEEASRQPIRFTDRTLDIIKHGPTTVEAAHVGEPTLETPKRTVAPDITKENIALFTEARNAGRPAAEATAATPTGPNEPPRSDQPSTAPLQGGGAPGGGSGVGVQVLNAPSGVAADPNALVRPVVPDNPGNIPAAEAPAAAPAQVNEIKPGTAQQTPATAADAKPKTDLNNESSSKKKKKKGLAKLNPF